MNTLYIKFKILFSIIFLIILSSCEDGEGFLDDDTNNNKPKNPLFESTPSPIVLVTIKGVLVDGYISGATVCIDISKDERCSEGDPITVTNAKGEFSLSADIKAYRPYILFASGGIDTAINAKFNSTYKAILTPKRNNKREARSTHVVNITPLSTLTSDIFSRKAKESSTYQASTAIETVSKSIGLTKEKLLDDPLKDIDIFEKTQEIVQTIKIISASIKADETNANAKETFDFVMNSLSDSIEDNKPTGKLEISALIDTLQKRSLHNHQVQVPYNIGTIATKNLENINKQIASLRKATGAINTSQLASVQKNTQKQTTKVAISVTPPQAIAKPEVVILAPRMASSATKTFTSTIAISPFIFTNKGGGIRSCSISEELPSGIIFNTTNCMISGTPNGGELDEKVYIISASNRTGSTALRLSITINKAPPVLLKPTIANASDKIFPLQSAISPFGFTNTGGAIASCSISGALSSGLTFNTTNCQISGTPANGVVAKKTYTITATNATGSDTAIVNITINDIAPSIADISTSHSFPKSTAITAIKFTNTGGAITSCGVTTGALPLGLTLNNTTCEITGTPSQTKLSATYTITATNATGNDTATVTIAVSDIAPSIANISGAKTFTKSTAIPAIDFSNSGGAITSCAMATGTSLPTGLVLNNTNCQITGTPSALKASALYTIKASNTIGDNTATVTIIVNDIAPNISNVSDVKTFTKGTAITTPIDFTNSGGAITSCSMATGTSLPAGLTLNLNSAKCQIAGTPSSSATPQAEYNIVGTNSGGSDSATINIIIIE